jgi:hypothetical protein
LLKEVDAVRGVYEKDKSLCLSLQLLGSVGKYLQHLKGSAHPEAVKLLQEIYDSIEILVTDDSVTEQNKKESLYQNVSRFKTVKEKIAKQKKAKIAERSKDGVSGKSAEDKDEPIVIPEPEIMEEEEPVEKILDLMRQMKPQEAFAYMLIEIKKAIREEIEQMK